MYFNGLIEFEIFVQKKINTANYYIKKKYRNNITTSEKLK